MSLLDFMTVFHRYEEELQSVEAALLDSVQSRNATLMQSSTQLLMAGGKRIRPLFALLCSHYGQGDRGKVIQLAAALEMVHMATLVHDDVIDDASVRRGQPTVRAHYGNRPAMYTGDFLFAKAIQLLVQVSHSGVHQEMSDAMVRVCEGEIDQIRDFYRWNQTFRNYLRRVERKTALLIAVSCSMGAMVADAPPAVVDSLRRFGHYTGMAFQIVDDVLDYVGDAGIVGKPVGGDLAQGNITLPALYAAQSSKHAPRLRQLIRVGMQQEEVTEAIQLIRDTDGIEQARGLAMTYMEKATAVLKQLPDSETKDQLAAVAAFVNQRAY